MADNNPKAPGARGILGLVLDINGQEVTVNSDTLTNAKKKGVDLALTKPVDLGTFEEMIKYFNSTFGVTIPTDASSLPAPLSTIITKVENLDVTIQKAHIKLPGTDDGKDATKLYTLVMNVLEKGDADLAKVGPMGIKGAVIGITNEPDPDKEKKPAD